VIGVDLVGVEALPPPVETLVGDICEAELRARVAALLGGPADLVLCDAATERHRRRGPRRHGGDHEAALAFCDSVLDGSLVMKAFPGPEADAIRAGCGGASRASPRCARRMAQHLEVLLDRGSDSAGRRAPGGPAAPPASGRRGAIHKVGRPAGDENRRSHGAQSINPATGKLLATYPEHAPEQAAAIADACGAAFGSWQRTSSRSAHGSCEAARLLPSTGSTAG
jgi:hypothetical protein